MIEYFARSLEAIPGKSFDPVTNDLLSLQSQILSLQNQLLNQQHELEIPQSQKQKLEEELAKNPDEVTQVTERKVALMLKTITGAFVAFKRNWHYTLL